MDNKPKVTIIMPVYKTEQYIEETIQSVLKQSYPNIELLCVNDDTPDGAFEICKEYQKKYPWIRLIENSKNQGQEATRNHGLDEMTGDYVLFLDSDDTISRDMLERMVDVAMEEDSDVVMSAYSMVVDGKEEPVLVHTASPLPRTMDMGTFADLLLDPIEWKILCCVGTKLYKTSLIQQNCLRFDRQYKYNEDGGFILSFLQLCWKVSYVNEPFYKYRIRSAGSIMSSYRPDMFRSIVKVNELLRDVLVSNQVFDRKRELYFRKLLFVIIDSLRNEVRFGNKMTFRQVLDTIFAYEDYGKMQDTLLYSGVLGAKQKVVLMLMKCHLYGLLYAMLKR